MAEGKRIADWDHTASLLCVHAPRGTNPARLNPYRRRQKGGSSLDAGEVRLWADSLALQKRREALQCSP